MYVTSSRQAGFRNKSKNLSKATPSPTSLSVNSIYSSVSAFRAIMLAGFSALIMGLALPNEIFLYGCWPLGFIALSPLYLSFKLAPSRKAALASGALYGALHHALTSYWLFFYKDFALWTIGASTAAYALVYLLPSLYLHEAAKQNSRWSPLLFGLLWAIFEFGKSTGFLGYPWGLIPYSLTSLPVLLQVVDVTGVYGLSFLLAFGAALTGSFLQTTGNIKVLRIPNLQKTVTVNSKDTSRALKQSPGLKAQSGRFFLPVVFGNPLPFSIQDPCKESPVQHRAWFVFLILLWLGVTGYGLIHFMIPNKTDGMLDVILIQQNEDPWYAGEDKVLLANVNLLSKALESRSKPGIPDLVVFSETSLRRPFSENKLFYETNPESMPLLPILRRTGVPLLTGAPYVIDWKEFSIMNAAILIDNQGNLVDVYGKTHPVPFTEAIPFMEYKWFRAFMKDVVGLSGGWTPGGRMTQFKVQVRSGGEVKFGVPICFEDAFADLCNRFVREGSDVLINITNDSWSRKVSAEIQHWAAARFRAIETRRPLIRSTNGGVTSVISADGKNLDELPLFEKAFLSMEVPISRNNRLTVYTFLGDWFVVLCALLSGYLSIVISKDNIRRRMS